MTRRRLIVLLMLLAVLIVVSLRLLAVGSSAFLLANTRSAPKIILPCDTRSLGTVSQGSVLRVTFPIRNAGGRRLVVSDSPDVCCGSRGQPHYVILGAGEAGAFTVKADTAKWWGCMRHTVHLSTNDPKRPRIVLTVEAIVTTALRSYKNSLPPEPCVPDSRTASSRAGDRTGIDRTALSRSY